MLLSYTITDTCRFRNVYSLFAQRSKIFYFLYSWKIVKKIYQDNPNCQLLSEQPICLTLLLLPYLWYFENRSQNVTLICDLVSEENIKFPRYINLSEKRNIINAAEIYHVVVKTIEKSVFRGHPQSTYQITHILGISDPLSPC